MSDIPDPLFPRVEFPDPPKIGRDTVNRTGEYGLYLFHRTGDNSTYSVMVPDGTHLQNTVLDDMEEGVLAGSFPTLRDALDEDTALRKIMTFSGYETFHYVPPAIVGATSWREALLRDILPQH